MNQEQTAYAIAMLLLLTVGNFAVLAAIYRNLKKKGDPEAEAFEKPFERKKKARPVTLYKASTGFGNHLLDQSET